MKGEKESVEACPLEPAYQPALPLGEAGKEEGGGAGAKIKQKRETARKRRARMSQGAGRRWKIATRMSGAGVEKKERE